MHMDSPLHHEVREPARLSRSLRQHRSNHPRRRCMGVGLSYAGVLIGGVVSAFQTGLIRRQPDILPGAFFDAERVDASDCAYARLQTPGCIRMMLTYGSTAALFAVGAKDRARRTPALPVTTAPKAGYDLYTAGKLAREEWQDNRALCSRCQVATVATACALVVALPEAITALRRSRSDDGRGQ